ncbi:acyl-CoA thioesterase [Clostridium sp. AF50-3]|uniref:acyl-CoA thioesterase n=1 Tax=unclassified Clostridium TaxID=2614128 RepID=UPI0026B74781
MELKIYEHKAQYYETDQMGIIHHANYLHWFEEARIDMMEQMGMGYDIMEKQGIISRCCRFTAIIRAWRGLARRCRCWFR